MAFYSRQDVTDDFDEYDPTPYGGGYDITVTYGRPLETSEEVCYPISSSSSSGDIDYDRPNYASYSEPSAYGDEALENEYKNYARPKPRPLPDYPVPPPGHEGFEGSGGGSEYGYQPKPPSSYGGEDEYGSGHGRKPDYEEPSSEYGSGYGRKPGHEQPSSEYGSGYGRKPEYEQPSSEYGSGYGRRPEYEQPSSEYGSGYGRKPEYEQPSSDYGSGYGRKPEYGSGYGRKPSFGEEQGGGGEYGYGGEGSPRRPQYGRPSYESSEMEEPPRRPSYGRPSYEGQEEEGYQRPSYERRDDDDDEPRKYGYGEEGYGHKKYVSTSMLFSL